LLSIIRSTIRYVTGSVTARPTKAAITESSISSNVIGKDGADCLRLPYFWLVQSANDKGAREEGG